MVQTLENSLAVLKELMTLSLFTQRESKYMFRQRVVHKCSCRLYLLQTKIEKELKCPAVRE